MRYFELISIGSLELKIKLIYDYNYRDLTPKISKDLSKVDFDTENYQDKPSNWGPAPNLLGYTTLHNGLTFLGIYAGGDWELPVFFIIYWDGKQLRGYIPKEGNWWNTCTKKAYGNDSEADLLNVKERFNIIELKDKGYVLDDEICELPRQEKLIVEDIKKHVILRK